MGHHARAAGKDLGPASALGALGLAIALVACGPDAPEAPVGAPAVRAAAPALGDLADLDPAAAELLRSAAAELDADPARAEAWTRLGVALHAHGRVELARDCYEERLRRDDGDARTWYWLALAAEDLGADERALACFAEAARRTPGFPPAHWRQGYARLARGELDAAETEMRAALEVAPHDAAAVVGLARVRLQRGDATAAAALLEEHLRRLPRDENARFLLGTAYRQLGRSEEAERSQAGAAGAAPLRDDPWEQELLAHRLGYRAEFLRAVDLLERGELAKATAALEALHARAPDDVLVDVSLHRAYRMGGRIDRAIELLLDARERAPLLDVVHLHLAGAYRDQAHRDGGAAAPALLAAALLSAETGCELSPTRADAHGMRGDVLADLGRAEEACAAHVRAADLDRDSAMWQERAGMALCAAGRWAEAVPYLRRLDLLRPDTPRTLFHLGAALANSGALAEARSTLEAAQRIAPDDAAIQNALEVLARQPVGGGGG